MTIKTKFAIFTAIFLWASAFVGIRQGLQSYSPEGLALFRYLIAAICMGVIYFRMPHRLSIPFRDACSLMGIGALGIGVYNITLNHGELFIASGMASFIISQAPLLSVLFAIVIYGEKLTFPRLLGFMVSVMGVALIAFSEPVMFKWNSGLAYIFTATIAGSLYSVLQ